MYHVMVRGINSQDIFEDDEDRLFFLNVIKDCKEISRFKLYGFCLMSNHVHLLLETGEEPLGQIMKRIGSRFVYWYNWKYQRTGHLFQDRYKSETVEDQSYFLTVLRYILQNPVKAGLVKQPGNYRWSSFQAYMKQEGSFTDTQFAIDITGSKEVLIQYLQEANDDKVMDEEDFHQRRTDEEARKIIQSMTGCRSVSDYQRLDRELKKSYAKKLIGEGLSMGQVSRLTGMSKTAVFSAVH